MQNWIFKECLQQLMQVYALAEQQYIYTANKCPVPVLKKFYEQRAYERMGFIDEVRTVADRLENTFPRRRTMEQLFREHVELYGEDVLNNLLVTDIESLIMDKKALEICHCLLEDGLPKTLSRLLKDQSVKIESGMLSMAYLKSEYGA